MTTPLDQAKRLCAEAERDHARLNGTGGTREALLLAGHLIGHLHGEVSAFDLQACVMLLEMKVPDPFLRNLYHGDLLRAAAAALAIQPQAQAA